MVQNDANDIGSMIDAANQEAHRRIVQGDPVLVDVQLAGDAFDGFGDRTLLHSGPPITYDRMCGPMKGAVAGALVFEGWAEDLAEAGELAASGEIAFQPNHHFNSVGPMTGVTTPSMAVWVVENRAFGNRAFCTLNEGMGNVMRFGGCDQEVVDRLHWLADTAGPAFGDAVRRRDGVPLKNIIARGLGMGDEMHMRNTASSSLFLREIAPTLAEGVTDNAELAGLFRFMVGNDMFFLNIGMAMAKSMIMAADGIDGSSVVTAMARNGTDFGIRLSSTGEAWFTAPAESAKGLHFPGFDESDDNPDIGDSCIVETVGLGGFAMAASPLVVGFVGAGLLSDAADFTRSMTDITIGPNPEWTIPTLDNMGLSTGIDVRKVVQTGVSPVINTAIVHREAGRGQVGAGVVRAPMACFEQALAAFAETLGVE